MASRTVRRLKQNNGNGNKERWRCAPVDPGAPFIVVTPPPPQQQLQQQQQSSNTEGVLCSVTTTATVRQQQQDDASVGDRWPRRDATPPRGSVCFFDFGLLFFDIFYVRLTGVLSLCRVSKWLIGRLLLFHCIFVILCWIKAFKVLLWFSWCCVICYASSLIWPFRLCLVIPWISFECFLCPSIERLSNHALYYLQHSIIIKYSIQMYN